ncbi:hypothetical protein TRFO_14151 [Tritrichomonas foetus]|uniref:Uncharacterized protein n=1 Tax=Tritrichomonas foetus TaxID=1144522 RepID=A0A1J4KVQ5_9EUKA|nr:hypothetical protein TRFO_14151 [Tritrichomonas foetus]|eukprot:OHT15393.1 hypothetical protein TRFO_14151 [Tritrichomonas foetus]
MDDIHDPDSFLINPKGIFFPLALAIFIPTLLLFYADLGNPLPPYYPWFKTDDCNALKFESFDIDNGDLNLTFFADETYELPREYLPNIIKVEGASEFMNLTYLGSRATKRSQNGSFVNIIIPFQYISKFHFLITCLKDTKLAEFTENINEVSKSLKGASSSQQIGPKREKFANVCIEPTKNGYNLLFFSMMKGEHSPFMFGQNNNLFYQTQESRFNEFLEQRDLKANKGNFIFTPVVDEEEWQLILFDLPEIYNIKEWSEFHTFEILSPKQSKTSNLLSNRAYEVKYLACYSSLAVAQFNNNVQITDHSLINEVLTKNFTEFRSRYVVDYVEKNKVAISENLPEIKKIIEKVCPKCKVTTFDNQFNHLNAVTNKANILIGNHLTNLAHIAMMNEKTHVIDFSPKEFACNRFFKDFAKKFNINYHSIWENIDHHCQCNNFSTCYSVKHDASYLNQDINLEYVRKLFLNILK